MRNWCSFSFNNTGNQLCFRFLFFLFSAIAWCFTAVMNWSFCPYISQFAVPAHVENYPFYIRYRWHGNGPGTGHQSCYCRFHGNHRGVRSQRQEFWPSCDQEKSPNHASPHQQCLQGGWRGWGGVWEGGCVRVSVNVNERIPWSNMWWINLEATTVLYDTAMSPAVQQHLSTVFWGCGSLQSFISSPSL